MFMPQRQRFYIKKIPLYARRENNMSKITYFKQNIKTMNIWRKGLQAIPTIATINPFFYMKLKALRNGWLSSLSLNPSLFFFLLVSSLYPFFIFFISLFFFLVFLIYLFFFFISLYMFSFSINLVVLFFLVFFILPYYQNKIILFKVTHRCFLF